MPYLGAHLSIAGGFPLAVDRAVAAGCDALQVFTKSAGQWRARPLPEEEARAFRRKLRASRLRCALGHNSYLINVATADPALRERSLAALGDELDRAEALGLVGLVMHPGAFGTGSPEQGLRHIAEALRHLLRERPGGRVRILLEHTAGQGTSLGHRFEHLAEIIDRLDGSPRVGVCLDTCHLLAAGYDLVTPEGYARTFHEFRRLVGLRRLQAMHLNDSKKPLGSRVDRHEHIGRGRIGLEPFRRLLTDARFRRVPMLLETPKSTDRTGTRIEVDPFDAMNLGVLRSLMRGHAGS